MLEHNRTPWKGMVNIMKRRLAFEYDTEKDGDLHSEIERIVTNKESGEFYNRTAAYVLREFVKARVTQMKKKLDS